MTKHYVIIAVVVGVLIVFGAVWWFTQKKKDETFANSPYPEVMLADGHCARRHESMANYYTTPYPYYPTGGYFKPLDKKIDFEDRNYTTLYTNKI